MSGDKTKNWSSSLREAGLLDEIEDGWSLPDSDDVDGGVIKVDGVAQDGAIVDREEEITESEIEFLDDDSDDAPVVEEIPFGIPVPSIPPEPYSQEHVADTSTERGVPWSRPPAAILDAPPSQGVVVASDSSHSSTGALGLKRDNGFSGKGGDFAEEEVAFEVNIRKSSARIRPGSNVSGGDGPPDFATERFFSDALASESLPPRETKDRIAAKSGATSSDSWGMNEKTRPPLNIIEESREQFREDETRPVPLEESLGLGTDTRPVTVSQVLAQMDDTRPVPISEVLAQEDDTRPVPISEVLSREDETLPVHLDVEESLLERPTSPNTISFDRLMLDLESGDGERETVAQAPSEQLLAEGSGRATEGYRGEEDAPFSVEETLDAMIEMGRMSSAPPGARREPLVPGPPPIPQGLLGVDEGATARHSRDEVVEKAVSPKPPFGESKERLSKDRFVSVRGQMISVQPSEPQSIESDQNAIIDESPMAAGGADTIDMASHSAGEVFASARSSAVEIGDERDAPEFGKNDPDPLEDMQELFDMGDYSGALSLAEAFLTDAPQNADAVRVRDSAKDILVQMYEARIGSLERIPILAISMEEVIWRNLDPATGFILSRIDGVCSFEDVCDISGLSRFETVRILGLLLQDGIIK